MVNFIGLSIVREIECYVITTTTTATKTIKKSPQKTTNRKIGIKSNGLHFLQGLLCDITGMKSWL